MSDPSKESRLVSFVAAGIISLRVKGAAVVSDKTYCQKPADSQFV